MPEVARKWLKQVANLHIKRSYGRWRSQFPEPFCSCKAPPIL